MAIICLSLFQPTDLSETQQQLLDINQRYEIVGERLVDRKAELENILASIKTFLHDLHDMISWLDEKDRQMGSPDKKVIPAHEKDAKKKLKEHEVNMFFGYFSFFFSVLINMICQKMMTYVFNITILLAVYNF